MEFHYPEKLEEAITLLDMPSSVAIGGGTSFITKPIAKHIVDLTGLGLNYISENKSEIIIGSTTTIAELIESQTIGQIASGALQVACKNIADTQLRNVITIGGNIACGFKWAILPPILMVLDATLEIVGKKRMKMPLEKFLDSGLKSGEFISKILIKKKLREGKGAFLKFSRTTTDYSLVSIASYVEFLKGRISVIRVAISGVASPMRIYSLEDQLKGKKINKGLLREAVARAVAKLSIADSYIVSKKYRRDLLSTLLERVLVDLLIEGVEWK